MIISCADRSPIGLWDLKNRVKAVRPDATINGYRDPEEALLHAKEEGCDVLVTEIDLGGPEREGVDFARRMQKINPKVNIIFVTAFSERDFAKDAIQMRVSGFVRKPYRQQQLAEEFANLRHAVNSESGHFYHSKMIFCLASPKENTSWQLLCNYLKIIALILNRTEYLIRRETHDHSLRGSKSVGLDGSEAQSEGCKAKRRGLRLPRTG